MRLERMLLDIAGFRTMEEFLGTVGPKTEVVTLIGGSSSRWKNELSDPITGPAFMKQYAIKDADAPRGLALVTNMLPPSSFMDAKPDTVPLVAYNLYGVQNILVSLDGKQHGHYIVMCQSDLNSVLKLLQNPMTLDDQGLPVAFGQSKALGTSEATTSPLGCKVH